jgi:NAD(P)-dependent dehydrogenase (short-subunit alcohol dehydrogenase family)
VLYSSADYLKEADMKSLEGKVVLVTGAASNRGMGHAIALRLAREGADVVVVDKYSVPQSLFPEDEGWGGLDEVVSEIESLGMKALAVMADVSSSSEVDKMVAKALEKFGQIDILVHCAGIRGPIMTPVVELAESDWRMVLDINLTGSFIVAKAVASSMLTKGQGGKIVLISSLVGEKGLFGSSAYCASKFGVIGLVKSLALELAAYKINVNAINPGAVLTNLRNTFHMKEAQAKGINISEFRERDYEKMRETIPLGRIGSADDIGNMALFLVSEQSDYITGEAINVTGGVS